MTRKPVQSTSVKSVGYDRANRILEVEFQSGATYQYQDVPPARYTELNKAESKGQYIARRIKGRYPYQRIDTPAA